jgi:Putative transmembrane protein (PGPGW)
MLDGMKEAWRQFRDAEPGKRFIEYYERRRESDEGKAGTIVSVGAGIALIAVGIVGLVAPGPGLLGIAFGAALIAREFRWAAVALDRFELLLRDLAERAKATWTRASWPLRSVIVSVAVVVAGLATYTAYTILFE